MWEVEDKPVIVLTALDYTFPLFRIIKEFTFWFKNCYCFLSAAGGYLFRSVIAVIAP